VTVQPTPAATPGLAPEEIMRLEDGRIVLLDQRRLPREERRLELREWPEVVDAISGMAVRGAPAIGIVGAMGVALAAQRAASDGGDVAAEVRRAAAALRAARPTAVNLAWAVDHQAALAAAHDGGPHELAGVLTAAARGLHRDEVERCLAIGEHARSLLSRGARVLTHCNAGALATGGYGTALGVVRAAHAADPSLRVVVDETRPLLQGARLTAWELARDGIPYTLIADGMAASLMAEGRVSHVVVGADRIAANGDVVNKIGTYGLAILAREHAIPFIVAAPTSTLDPRAATGADVAVEERSADEMRAIALFDRPAVAGDASVSNPAFDRTPARLVSAVVTERGVHRPPYDRSLAEAWAGGVGGAVTAPG
jgi:methylthioribose-1-phosphate isomerase